MPVSMKDSILYANYTWSSLPSFCQNQEVVEFDWQMLADRWKVESILIQYPCKDKTFRELVVTTLIDNIDMKVGRQNQMVMNIY